MIDNEHHHTVLVALTATKAMKDERGPGLGYFTLCYVYSFTFAGSRLLHPLSTNCVTIIYTENVYVVVMLVILLETFL